MHLLAFAVNSKYIKMLLELKNISKQYKNGDTDRQVLDDISLSIDIGDALAIIGPSGSGKSTLLNIMGTLDRPSSGSVTMNDIDIYIQEGQLESRLAKYNPIWKNIETIKNMKMGRC